MAHARLCGAHGGDRLPGSSILLEAVLALFAFMAVVVFAITCLGMVD
jgi:hypothetical protein